MNNSTNAQPCVCTRTLCVFSFQTLGVMADAAEAIATDSDVCTVSNGDIVHLINAHHQVVDLLVAMANAAVCSSRNSIIFDPYPSIVDPHNSNFLALDPKVCDYHVHAVYGCDRSYAE